MDKLSQQQKAILIELTRQTCWHEVHAAEQDWWWRAFGVPLAACDTHVQAASRSRALRRLVARGLVEHQRWYRAAKLTAQGRAIGGQLEAIRKVRIGLTYGSHGYYRIFDGGLPNDCPNS